MPGETDGVTPFHPEDGPQITPFPQPKEATKNTRIEPDFVPDPEFAGKETLPNLDKLAIRYQQTIDSQASRFSFSDKTDAALEYASDFWKENKFKLVIPVLVVPIFFQQIAEGYSWQVSLVKTLDELMRGEAVSQMDPSHAIGLVHSIAQGDVRDFGKIAVQELADIMNDYRVGVHDVIVWTFVLNLIEKVRNSKKETHEAIEKGTAKVQPRGEQIFVLGGRGGSYIGEALKKNNPKGVTAIFENERGGAAIPSLLPHEADRLNSLFLNLQMDEENHTTYSGAPGWRQLELKKNNLIHTKDGRDVLCVVGIDAANEDEWLGIPKEDHDLAFDEHYSSVLKLQEKLDDQHVETCGIWVGDANRKEVDEETGDLTTTSREAALENGIQVYIDILSVAVQAIEDNIQKDINNEVCEYPCGVRLISGRVDYHTSFDGVAEALSLPLIKKEDDKEDKAILIVYEETSDKTLHTTKRLMERYPGRKIIAVTSNLGAHKNALDQGIQSICLAQVIADEVSRVRSKIKNGTPYDKIQQQLDRAHPLHSSHDTSSHLGNEDVS